MTTKRFFVNGKPSGMLDQHGRYMIPVMNLLAECKSLGLPQREQVVEEEQGIVLDWTRQGKPDDWEEQTYMLVSATIRAKVDPDEVWVDLRVVKVPKQEKVVSEGGGDEYLWVGVRMGDGWVKDWTYDASPIIVLIQEPNNADSTARQEVGTHISYRTRTSNPKQWFPPDSTGTASYSRTQAALPKVLMTDDGLCFTSTQWYGNVGTYTTPDTAVPDPWWIENDTTSYHWCYEAPFDPLHPGDEQEIPNAAVAKFPAQPALRPRWDYVAWLDTALTPIDTDTGHVTSFLKVPQGMADLGVTPKVLSGQYAVMVGITDGWCQTEDWAAANDNEIEVEIRVGRPPNQIRKRFLVNPLNYTSYPSCAVTYGYEKPDDITSWCPYEYGPNPKWKNWWQGAFLVDVKNKIIEASPYYFPGNGSFEVREMANWECMARPIYQLAFCGTSTPTSNAFSSSPQFPYWMAPAVMVASGIGYTFPWNDPAKYPVACPNFCDGGSVMNLRLQDTELPAASGSGAAFGKMYLYWTNYNYTLGLFESSYTETDINVQDYILELPDTDGPEVRKSIDLAMSKFVTEGYRGYAQQFGVVIPGVGLNYINTDPYSGDDVFAGLGCYDNIDTFTSPQPATEIPIPDGE